MLSRFNFGKSLRWRASGNLLGILLGGVLILPSSLAGQGFGGGDCALDDFGMINSQDFGSGRVFWYSSPIFRCTDGTRIQTDSAVVFDATGEHELIGRVRMTSPSRTLRGDRVNYNSRSGVLFARGAVTFTDPAEGTEIQGDTLRFQAAGAGLPDDLITVSGRQARATFPPGGAPGAPAGDAAAGPVAPYVVTADRMRFQGSRFFWAGGEVRVLRDSLDASADSLVFNQEGGELLLVGESSLVSSGLLFLGDQMAIAMPNDALTGVVVTGNARMETDEMTMVGGEVRVELQEEKIQRIVAVQRGEGEESLPRPYVVAEEVFLMSDSIDVRTPGEILESIFAVGNSWSERRTPGDTLPDLTGGLPSERPIDPANPPTQDWIEGDEIEIGFEQITDQGSEGYELTFLHAAGKAGSFYRSTGQGVGQEDEEGEGEGEGEDTSDRQQVFDYIRANEIRMTFQNGEATHVEAVGMAVGVHVELPYPPTSAETNEVSDD